MRGQAEKVVRAAIESTRPQDQYRLVIGDTSVIGRVVWQGIQWVK